MAKSTGLYMQCYVGGYDLSGDVGAIDSISTPRSVIDLTAINQSAMDRGLTRADSSIGFTAYFNDAADRAHDALSTLPTANRTVVVAKSTTRAAVAFGMQAKQIGYDPSRDAVGNLTISVSAQGSGGKSPGWGVMLSAGLETHASAGSKASVDNAAATSNGAGIWAHAMSLGSGTPTLLVEHSTDNSIWATLATLTINGANEHEYASVAGTVNRYLRLTTTGTFTNFAVAVMLRRFTADDLEAAA